MLDLLSNGSTDRKEIENKCFLTSLPNDKVLDVTILKAFKNEKLNVAKTKISL